MLPNDRDEINYHKFLKSMRKAQGVSLENVSLGIYTKSAMSRIEAGGRLPDKLVRDRFTARLGISGEEYEEYLLPREYKQWECRMEIIRCINKKNIIEAEEKIAAYAENYDGNQVDIQFPIAMQFMVMKMKGCSNEELYAQVREAIDCTIVDVDAALDGLHLLADQELNLIMEYIRLRKEVVPENDLMEWKISMYHKVRLYVENSRLDKIARAKVYSKLACFVAELVLDAHKGELDTKDALYLISNKERLLDTLELCNCAIESLRDSLRLYYFVELNEYRMKLIDALGVSTDDEFRELYQTSKEWANLLDEMYKENNLPTYMENDTHLYTETECNNVCRVIRTRRAMMGVNRETFCGNEGEVKTLARIEREEENPTMATVRLMFDRCGLCAEYKRARIITSDVEALKLAGDFIVHMNKGEFDKASKVYTRLYEIIDMDILFNKQTMKRYETMLLEKTGKLTTEEHREMIIDVLECTLSLAAVSSDGEKYFTLSELSSVHDLAKYTKGKDSQLCWKYMEKLCFEALDKEELESSHFHVYEFLMAQCSNHMGNEGRHLESKLISQKLLKESLHNRRMYYLLTCEYNIFWNHQKLLEINNETVDNDKYYKLLNKGLLLSILSKKQDWKNFFQRKIKNLDIIA